MEKEHILYIFPNVLTYIQDEEGLSFGGGDDIIENHEPGLQPRFRIVIPGISEWYKRYARATDFAGMTTDPYFDWRTWHYDGLILAKELFRQLPGNYNLVYRHPYEDLSGTLGKVDFSKDAVDDIIKLLEPMLLVSDEEKPSYKDNVAFAVRHNESSLWEITLKIGNLECRLEIKNLEDLREVRHWLEQIARDESDVIQTIAFNHRNCIAYMIPQRVGRFPMMGQIRIEDIHGKKLFGAYVNRREFVKGLYLTLMNRFGFGIYTTGEFQDRTKCWLPYNTLRSDVIEWYITDDLFAKYPIPADPLPKVVNETISMWVDYGCCFWDTMGLGAGDEDGLFLDSGEFDMNIPGLKDWISRWAVPAEYKTGFAEWWKEGWNLAREVRKRLPSNIDIYYMGYDSKQPDKLLGHHSARPFIIVPYHEEKTNAMGLKASGYASRLARIDLKDKNEVNSILGQLPSLKLDKGYKMGLLRRGNRFASVCQLYTYRTTAVGKWRPGFRKVKNDKSKWMFLWDDDSYVEGVVTCNYAPKTPSVFKHITVPFTEEGIIDAWLLHRAPYFLPRFWHARYGSADHIFSTGVVDAVIRHLQTKNSQRCSDPIGKLKALDSESLLPSVSINGRIATVTFSYWNDWRGLVTETEIIQKKGKRVSFKGGEETIHIKYNCGVRL